MKGWIVGNPVTSPDSYYLPYYGSFGVEDLNTLINFGIMNESLANDYWDVCLHRTTNCHDLNTHIMNLTSTNYDSKS